LVCVAVAALASTAFGADDYWQVDSSGYWDVGANWSLGTPASGERVYIGYSPYAYTGLTTTLRTGDYSLAALFSKDAFSMTGGSLLLSSTSQTSQLSDGFTLSGGVFGGASTVSISGGFVWMGGALDGSGTINAYGAGTWGAGGSLALQSTEALCNYGTVDWKGSALSLDSGARLLNESGATIAASAGSLMTGGTFANYGTFTSSSMGTATLLDVVLTNSSTLQSTAGTLELESLAGYSNTGHIQANGATAVVGFNGGSYSLTKLGNVTAINGGQIDWGAVLNCGGSTLDLSRFGAAGSFVVANGTISDATITHPELLRVANYSSLTLDEVTCNSPIDFYVGNASIPSGVSRGTVTIQDGTSLQLSGDHTIDYDLRVAPATSNDNIISEGTGSIVVASVGAIDVDSSVCFNQYTNTDNTSFVNNGTFNVGLGGAADFLSYGSMSFVNNGSIQCVGTAGSANQSLAVDYCVTALQTDQIWNAGTMTVQGGLVELYGGGDTKFRNTGTISVTDGGRVKLMQSDGAAWIGSIVWSNEGILKADGSGSGFDIGNTITTAGLGNITLTNGATLAFRCGELNNTNSVFDPETYGPAGTVLVQSGEIHGGTILHSNEILCQTFDDGGAQFDDTVLQGGLNLTNGGLAEISGGTQVDGSVNMDRGAYFELRYGNPVLDFTINCGKTAGATKEVLDLYGYTDAADQNEIGPTGAIIGAYCGISSEMLTNEGLISAQNSADTMSVWTFYDFTNEGTLAAKDGATLDLGTEVQGSVTNVSGGTLSGGTYEVGANGKILLKNLNVVTNAATILLSGANSNLEDQKGADGLRNFAVNQGTFGISSGRNFAASGGFTNTGTVQISNGSIFTASSLEQSAGTIEVDGTLTVPTFLLDGGLLSGSGQIVGTVQNSGSLRPGDSPGILTVQGDYHQAQGGALDIVIGGSSISGLYSRLAVTGGAYLDGDLDISVLNGVQLQRGETFEILTASGGTFGQFSGINDPADWQIQYGNGFVDVKSVVPEPATFLTLAAGVAALLRRRRK
jgi:fibronectin-binding autotransporter adhesin